MVSAKDVGISEAEFQDAVNLEKLYGLVNKGNDRCANCRSSPVSHVDCNNYKFLCHSCGSGKDNCKRIGDDRFKKYEIDKLERKFGGSSSGGRSGSGGNIGRSRSDRSKRSRRKKSRRRRSPSPSSSESESQSDSEDYHSHKSSSKKRSRSHPPGRSESGFAVGGFGDSSRPQTADPFGGGGGMAGMAGMGGMGGMGGMAGMMGLMSQQRPFPMQTATSQAFGTSQGFGTSYPNMGMSMGGGMPPYGMQQNRPNFMTTQGGLGMMAGRPRMPFPFNTAMGNNPMMGGGGNPFLSSTRPPSMQMNPPNPFQSTPPSPMTGNPFASSLGTVNPSPQSMGFGGGAATAMDPFGQNRFMSNPAMQGGGGMIPPMQPPHASAGVHNPYASTSMGMGRSFSNPNMAMVGGNQQMRDWWDS